MATGEVDQGQEIDTAMNRGNVTVMAGHTKTMAKEASMQSHVTMKSHVTI